MTLGLCVTRYFVGRLLTGIARSSIECFGLHLGGFQTANLGDSNGNVSQTMVLRENLPLGGTCGESLFGGNHLRMFRQDGANHNTGALFLVCVACLTYRVWFLIKCLIVFPRNR
jgi:hypothetical protein